MAVTVKSRFVPEMHAEVVTLTDDFGVQAVLTLPLVEPDGYGGFRKAEIDKIIESTKEEMETRERIVREHASERGHKLEQQYAQPMEGDCGCK